MSPQSYTKCRVIYYLLAIGEALHVPDNLLILHSVYNSRLLKFKSVNSVPRLVTFYTASTFYF